MAVVRNPRYDEQDAGREQRKMSANGIRSQLSEFYQPEINSLEASTQITHIRIFVFCETQTILRQWGHEFANRHIH
jgi:hypothetical protein